MPYIQKAPFKTDNVTICWDGSRAARALLPMRSRFSAKAVVSKSSASLTNPASKTRSRGPIAGRHLARHGLKVDVHRISGGDIDVADALLSHAADSSADFMVMGGYGHSRLREFVLGGVTRLIFKSMTVPVLLSH